MLDRIRTPVSLAILLLIAAFAGGSAVVAAEGGSDAARAVHPRTIATIRGHVVAFAQNDGYLAWLSEGRCALRIQRLRTGVRTRVTRGRERGCGLLGVGGLVLVRDRAYWDKRDASLSTEYSELRSASLRDPKIRDLEYQSHAQGTFDQLLPPTSDGKGVFFWSSPEDATPGPVVRYDALRRTEVSSTQDDLRALSAGGLRYGLLRAIYTYDCADAPAWSPDGTRIAYASTAFQSGRNCKGGLWVTKTDGSGERKIAELGGNPDWAPDGSTLAFEVGGVAVISADGGEARLLVPGGSSPSWSPDGTQLAFAGGGGIYVAAADGTGMRLVTPAGSQPDWSPDGSRLVFANGGGLRVISVDGSGLRTLTQYGSDPAWSPDGRTVAYTSFPGVYTVNADGTGRPTSLDCTNFVEISCWGPTWAPDSRRIAYVSAQDDKDNGDSHLFAPGTRAGTDTPRPQTPIVVTSRGGRRKTIAPGGEAFALAVTGEMTAALVRAGSSWRIEISGNRARSVALRHGRPPRLAASGHTVVFRIRRTIYALDAASGELRVVARSSGTPIGLSIVGRRVAWAENLRRGARVRAVVLPRSS
jgi:hypothetical protein